MYGTARNVHRHARSVLFQGVVLSLAAMAFMGLLRGPLKSSTLLYAAQHSEAGKVLSKRFAYSTLHLHIAKVLVSGYAR